MSGREENKTILLNADIRRSKANFRRLNRKTICDHLHSICVNPRLKGISQLFYERINPIYIMIFFIAALSVASLGFVSPGLIWSGSGRGIQEAGIRCLAVEAQNSKSVFAGTDKALYSSIDNGENFIPILRVLGSQKSINDIYIREDSPEVVYAATDSGLFESRDAGNTWERIFFAGDEFERQCQCVVSDQNAVYVGTKKGLFYKKHTSQEWARSKGDLSGQAIFKCSIDKQSVYLSTASQIYRLDKATESPKKIFSLISSENSDAQNTNQIKGLLVVADTGILYAATTKGIFYTDDNGLLWNKIRSNGIPTESISSISVSSDNTIFLGTGRGVFAYKENRWEQVYKGMHAQKVNFLASSHDGELYAATDSGFFILNEKQALSNVANISYRDLAMRLEYEPTISEVHAMAIDYAEVSPRKIKSWRTLAQRRAWLPSVSLGVDGDKNMTRGDSVYGSSSGSSYVGPDDKTFYDNLGWDVSLSWDLGDLVWSTDQTTIDSRSKLMVELREDILDQVTRLYFERRRLQAELLAAQPDSQEKFDKNMRIDELTALIDSLTGGRFSEEIEKRKGKE